MYYNYIKCKAICLGIKQLIKIWGKPLAKSVNRQLAVFTTIFRPFTYFLTGLCACLPACLPACAYLSVPICLCLPVCICLWWYQGVSDSIRGRVGPIEGSD